MPRNRIHTLEKVRLTEAAAKGKAMGHAEDGRVVFVANAVPGDLVDVQARLKKKRFYEGKATNFHEYSDKRVEPKCIHFGVCGGCKWQFMDYEAQLFYKQKEVTDNLTKIGKAPLQQVKEIIKADEIYYYRNKMEFSYSEDRWVTDEEIASGEELEKGPALGFHAPGRWDKSIDLKECHLQAEPSNSIRLKAKEIALEQGLSFFNPRKQEGFLRTLMIRTSSTGEIMILVQFFHNDQQAIKAYLDALIESFEQVTSWMYCVNSKANDSLYDQDVKLYKGKDYIEEEMEGLRFRVGPKSFYQTNSAQAYKLYLKTRELAGLTGQERVYDLYTGTGTIAQFVAKQAKEVIGIEYVEAAIEDAKINMLVNGLSNLKFFAGNMKDVLNTEFIEEHGKPDVVITDPPRDGMHKDVVAKLLEMKAPRIVYVSCNVATQARDLELLSELYEVKQVQAVDMFPQTHHVENILLLELKS